MEKKNYSLKIKEEKVSNILLVNYYKMEINSRIIVS